MKKIYGLRLFTLVLVLIPFLSHAEIQWVVGNTSCAAVCGSVNSSPVQSGVYKNGNPFYVCRANAQGEGMRAGYNLQPSWSEKCTVGWGGKELPIAQYECLCVN